MCLKMLIKLTLLKFIVSPLGGVSTSPASANSAVGETVALSCSTRGGPGNSFTWAFTGVSGDLEEVGNTSDITVTIMDVFDGGEYTCEVQNEAGNDTNTTLIFGMGNMDLM